MRLADSLAASGFVGDDSVSNGFGKTSSPMVSDAMLRSEQANKKKNQFARQVNAKRLNPGCIELLTEKHGVGWRDRCLSLTASKRPRDTATEHVRRNMHSRASRAEFQVVVCFPRRANIDSDRSFSAQDSLGPAVRHAYKGLRRDHRLRRFRGGQNSNAALMRG